VRLDHLLSKEIRVSILGGIEAQMAPRLIARSPASPQPGGARSTPQGVGGRMRPGENTENPRPSVVGWIAATLLGSRAQPTALVNDGAGLGAGPAGV
jgi:hypothetical protein